MKLRPMAVRLLDVFVSAHVESRTSYQQGGEPGRSGCVSRYTRGNKASRLGHRKCSTSIRSVS
jgi:hypothetical protein